MVLPCKAIREGRICRSFVQSFRQSGIFYVSLCVMDYSSLPTVIIDSGTGVLKAGLSGHNLRPTVKMQCPNTIDKITLSHNLPNLDRNQRRSVTNFDRLKEVSKKLVLERHLQCEIGR